jgi:hypothetical protein
MTDPGSGRPGAARDERLGYALFQLARAHRSHAAALLRTMNPHPGQELLLMQLLDRDGRAQSELLESVGLDHSTVFDKDPDSVRHRQGRRTAPAQIRAFAVEVVPAVREALARET